MPDSHRTPPNDRWPDWLRELWGPEPEGPRRRAEEIARTQERARLAEEWRRRQHQGIDEPEEEPK